MKASKHYTKLAGIALVVVAAAAMVTSFASKINIKHSLFLSHAENNYSLTLNSNILKQKLQSVEGDVIEVFDAWYEDSAEYRWKRETLQGLLAPLELGGEVCAAGRLLHYDCLLHSLFRLVLPQHLLDAPKEVLHEADLRHVVALQNAKLLRQIIGVHVLITWQQQPGAVLLYEREESAPFVLNPYSVEMLCLFAHNHHDLRTVEGSKDVGLIF